MEAPIAKETKIFDRYKSIRKQSELICKPLKPEDYVVQPITDVSPPKWHLAHTTWFFEKFVLEPFKSGYKCYHPDYNYLFNSYYESVGERVLRTDRGNITRPGVEEIMAYREYVDINIEELGASHDLPDDFVKVMEIGLQHEQQHQELLITDIKYILGHNPIFPKYFSNDKPVSKDERMSYEWIEVPEGIYQVGHEGRGFCFDNELGSHQVYLASYRIADRLVTNQQYLKFIEDGGYDDFKYWLMEGWEWIRSEGIKAPLYWHKLENQWLSYDLYGLNQINPNAPVTHISFYEADAYARWCNMRLPTEFEWEIACKMYQPNIQQSCTFQETGKFIPQPSVDDNKQFLGDTWEWTGSPYRPYPGFKQAEGALGEYNGKFMVNQMVLRGGSCATPSDHIRTTYRNFFHPHLRWQFTGIRLATDIE